MMVEMRQLRQRVQYLSVETCFNDIRVSARLSSISKFSAQSNRF
jgi:hypothetical protein